MVGSEKYDSQSVPITEIINVIAMEIIATSHMNGIHRLLEVMCENRFTPIKFPVQFGNAPHTCKSNS